MRSERGRSRSGGGEPGGRQPPLRIFVSYRRADTADAADHLFADLSTRIDWEVFMDIDSIDPGVDYSTVIEESVASCDVLLALIGKRWLAAADEKGRRRLEDPEDWVRMEIQAALDRDVRVIPILLQEAEMPSRDQLPTPLEGLPKRQAHEIDRTHWPDDVGRLEKALEKIHATKGQLAVQPAVSPKPDGPMDGTKRRQALTVGGALVGAVILSAVLVWWLVRDGSPPSNGASPEGESPGAQQPVAGAVYSGETDQGEPMHFRVWLDGRSIRDLTVPLMGECSDGGPFTSTYRQGEATGFVITGGILSGSSSISGVSGEIVSGIFRLHATFEDSGRTAKGVVSEHAEIRTVPRVTRPKSDSRPLQRGDSERWLVLMTSEGLVFSEAVPRTTQPRGHTT